MAKKPADSMASDVPAHAGRSRTGETRGAEFITVAWMLTSFATLFGEIVTTVAWLVVWLRFADKLEAQAIPRLLTFVTAVSATVALLLTPLTLRIRQARPPRQITIAVLVIGLIPWIAILAMLYWLPEL